MICDWFTFVQECDVPNWVALAIELIIGGSLALFFFIRQKKQGAKLQKIIDEQEEFRKKRYNWTIASLRSLFPNLKENLKELEKNAQKYYELLKPTQESEFFETLIEAQELLREHYVIRMEKISDQSVGIISPEIIEKIDDIIATSKRKVREVTSDGIKYNQIYYQSAIAGIDDLLKNHLN